MNIAFTSTHCTHIPIQVVSAYVLLEPDEKQLGLRGPCDRQAVTIKNSFQPGTSLKRTMSSLVFFPSLAKRFRL